MNDDIYPSFRSRLFKWLLTLFFKLLYHPFAWMYDTVAAAVSMGRWKQWVMAAAERVEGPRVLELGFGPGHLQAHLNSSGFTGFGLDESPQMARQARGRLVRKRLSPRLSRGLAQNLPFASEQFNSVVATFPTLYIVDSSTISEIKRVLLPGGKLVVLFSAWVTGQSLPEKALALLFQVTGQVPQKMVVEDEQPIILPFREAGFQADVKYVETKGGRLLFILAQKES